jgi:hypothetical protein
MKDRDILNVRKGENLEERCVIGSRQQRRLTMRSLIIKMMNGRFPRLAKLVLVFAIKIIRMFFNYKSFPNEARGVVWG